MPRKGRGTLVWSMSRANREFRQAGLTPDQVETGLLGRGFRIQVRRWFDPHNPVSPSIGAFLAVLEILGLQNEPFDVVTARFYDKLED